MDDKNYDWFLEIQNIFKEILSHIGAGVHNVKKVTRTDLPPFLTLCIYSYIEFPP